jgi:uncharacterized OB-fold protein
MNPATRTLPVPTPDSDRFWQGCADGQLWMQRCRDCGQINWFPRGFCVTCMADALEWEQLSGHGTVYSFSVVDRPVSAAYPPRYVLALVDLDEGPRMMTHLVDMDAEAIRIGLAVQVRFEQHGDISLPVFGPAAAGSGSRS